MRRPQPPQGAEAWVGSAPKPAVGTALRAPRSWVSDLCPCEKTRFCLWEGKQDPRSRGFPGLPPTHGSSRGVTGPTQELGVGPVPGLLLAPLGRWAGPFHAGIPTCQAGPGTGLEFQQEPRGPRRVLPAPAVGQSCSAEAGGAATGSLAIPREATALCWCFCKIQNRCRVWVHDAGGSLGRRRAGKAQGPQGPSPPTISALLQGPLHVLSLLRGQRGRKDEDKASQGRGYLADLWRG